MDLDMLPIGRVGGLQNMSSPLHEQPCSARSMACSKCESHGKLDACDDIRHPECCGRDSRLTFEEQRTMMTLWSISKSTLFVGGDPTAMSDAQASLFLNEEVLHVNAAGTRPRQVFCLPQASCTCNLTNPPAHSHVVWASDLDDGGDIDRSFVALFNLGNSGEIPSVLGGTRSEVSIELSQVRASWGAHSNCSMRDLWQGRELGRVEGGAVSVSLALHDAALLSISCS